MLKIKKRSTKSITVEVEVLNLKWIGSAKEEALQNFRCSACWQPVGENRFAIAWIKDGQQERSMRLCESCAKEAEK